MSAISFSLLAGVGFDATVWEVWPYLTAGASLYLPDKPTRLAPEALRDWMIANQITVSFLPTALAERVMVLDWPRDAALRFLLTGADTLHRYPEKNLPFELVNNYGPTEAAIWSTGFECHEEHSQMASIPIGRPIPNAEIYLLDAHLNPVPVGVPA